MADIELIIKIDDYDKEWIHNAYDIPSEIKSKIVDAIENGTPLPKGHGRLKDIDEIEWYGCTTAFYCPHKDRECKDCNKAECSKTQVDDIPTIIEADNKEMEE